MKRTIVAVLLLGYSWSAWAADNSGAYFTAGSFSCGQFIDGVRTNRMVQHTAWIAGYLTAFNRQTPDTFDIRGGTDTPSVLLWMENYCKQNPLKDIEDGMTQLTAELHPRRHRAAKDAGR